MICDKGDVERAQVGYLPKSLEEEMLRHDQHEILLSCNINTDPILVVDGNAQLSKTTHSATSDEIEDISTWHPRPPS